MATTARKGSTVSVKSDTALLSGTPLPSAAKDPKAAFRKVTPEMRQAADGLYFVIHESFLKANALKTYGLESSDGESYPGSFMPDEITRACAQRMHYAVYRLHREKNEKARKMWRDRFYQMRDRIVLGNRKLIFRAVRRWTPNGLMADDLVGDCHIVLIQAVSAFNPFLGIRFSTYAFTCLMRALSRLSQKIQGDKLSRSMSLDSLPDGEPRDDASYQSPSLGMRQIDVFLQESHTLLTPREKRVLTSRFCLDERSKAGTLEQVGAELGLSKERVRQVQSSALAKLKTVLTPPERTD